MNVLDTIDTNYDTDSMFIAAQGISQKWSMRRELLTPQYSSSWSDMPSIMC